MIVTTHLIVYTHVFCIHTHTDKHRSYYMLPFPESPPPSTQCTASSCWTTRCLRTARRPPTRRSARKTQRPPATCEICKPLTTQTTQGTSPSTPAGWCVALFAFLQVGVWYCSRSCRLACGILRIPAGWRVALFAFPPVGVWHCSHVLVRC